MHFLKKTVRNSLSLLMWSMLILSCKSSGPTSESPSTTTTRSIEMDRPPCSYGCPSYYLRVFEDGSAEFIGKENTEFIGDFIGKVDPEFNQILWKSVEAADLKNKKARYGTGNEDTPEIRIKYVGEDFDKEIIFQSFEPIEINEIERHLKIIAENTPWKKPEE